MSNDTLERLKGMTNSKAQQQETLRNIPAWIREEQPLDEFEGDFAGVENGSKVTKGGTVLSTLKFIHENVKALKKADANFDWQDGGRYIIEYVEPREDRIATSEYGMMQASAVEAKAVKDSYTELIGHRVHYVRDARKPWPTAERDTYYYKVVGNGTMATPPAATIDPAAEESANAYLRTLLTDNGGDVDAAEKAFREGAIKYLSGEGVNDDALFVEIAQGKFTKRMREEGRV